MLPVVVYHPHPGHETSGAAWIRLPHVHLLRKSVISYNTKRHLRVITWIRVWETTRWRKSYKIHEMSNDYIEMNNLIKVAHPRNSFQMFFFPFGSVVDTSIVFSDVCSKVNQRETIISITDSQKHHTEKPLIVEV